MKTHHQEKCAHKNILRGGYMERDSCIDCGEHGFFSSPKDQEKCECRCHAWPKEEQSLCSFCRHAPSPHTEGWASRYEYKKKIGAMHKYLDTHYGKPVTCEFCKKDYVGRWKMDWALKKGREYSKNRKDYYRLCKSCHRRYDMTEDIKKKALRNLWWKRGISNPGTRGNLNNMWWGKDKKKMGDKKLLFDEHGKFAPQPKEAI